MPICMITLKMFIKIKFIMYIRRIYMFIFLFLSAFIPAVFSILLRNSCMFLLCILMMIALCLLLFENKILTTLVAVIQAIITGYMIYLYLNDYTRSAVVLLVAIISIVNIVYLIMEMFVFKDTEVS